MFILPPHCTVPSVFGTVTITPAAVSEPPVAWSLQCAAAVSHTPLKWARFFCYLKETALLRSQSQLELGLAIYRLSFALQTSPSPVCNGRQVLVTAFCNCRHRRAPPPEFCVTATCNRRLSRRLAPGAPSTSVTKRPFSLCFLGTTALWVPARVAVPLSWPVW